MNDFLQWTRVAFRRQHGLEESALSPHPAPADDALFRLACCHRVAGLWAAELVPSWKQYAYGQAQHAVRCALEAERIAVQMQERIPDIAIIKGPALAVQAWPQPGLRHFDDLDFRCGRVEVSRLRDALGTLGYQPAITDTRRLGHLWHYGWGVAFTRADGFMLEFNDRLFPPHFLCPARLNSSNTGLWGPLVLEQHPVATLLPAPHLLYCCMHAIWHGWERLIWAADIAGLMVRWPDALAGARVLAGDAGFARRALECACRVANGLFGPLPCYPVRTPDGDEDLREAVSLLMRTDGPSGFSRARLLRRRLYNRREIVQSTLRRMATPGDPDFQRWSFAAFNRHWYWVLRPFRLLATRRW